MSDAGDGFWRIGSLDPTTGSLDPMTGSLDPMIGSGLGLTCWPLEEELRRMVAIMMKTNAEVMEFIFLE